MVDKDRPIDMERVTMGADCFSDMGIEHTNVRESNPLTWNEGVEPFDME